MNPQTLRHTLMIDLKQRRNVESGSVQWIFYAAFVQRKIKHRKICLLKLDPQLSVIFLFVQSLCNLRETRLVQSPS